MESDDLHSDTVTSDTLYYLKQSQVCPGLNRSEIGYPFQ